MQQSLQASIVIVVCWLRSNSRSGVYLMQRSTRTAAYHGGTSRGDLALFGFAQYMNIWLAPAGHTVTVRPSINEATARYDSHGGIVKCHTVLERGA